MGGVGLGERVHIICACLSARASRAGCTHVSVTDLGLWINYFGSVNVSKLVNVISERQGASKDAL